MVLRIRAKKESEIEKEIGHFLYYFSRSRDFAFYKQNTRGYFSGRQIDHYGKRVFVGHFRKDANPFARTGISDWAIIYKGFFIAFETKTEYGRQTENQKEYEHYLKSKGKGRYEIVRSVEECEKKLKKIFNEIDEVLKASESLEK